MKDHDNQVQTLATWAKKYGPVYRVGLGERETVSATNCRDQNLWISLQVVLNSHQSLVQTIVAQGPAFISRPTFKLFHSDFGSSGIWTIGSE
jgi:hypothetical protein